VTQVGVLDYGISNVGSVQNAFDFIGVKSRLAHTAQDIADCSHLVVPGDGSFPEGMACLYQTGLDDAVLRAAEAGKMILGICLGMQLFADEGEEFGRTKGLGLIPGRVVLMKPNDPSLTLPQIGWNDVILRDHSRLRGGLGKRATFYFMQSFVFSDPSSPYVTAQCEYGGPHVSAVEKDNVLGVQFHPEKSQRSGIYMLKTFAEMT
jgi:imidazole glycerol-phosphate synthase subunit HisH